MLYWVWHNKMKNSNIMQTTQNINPVSSIQNPESTNPVPVPGAERKPHCNDSTIQRFNDPSSPVPLTGSPTHPLTTASGILPPDPIPSPEPVDGKALLDELAANFPRFAVLPKWA